VQKLYKSIKIFQSWSQNVLPPFLWFTVYSYQLVAACQLTYSSSRPKCRCKCPCIHIGLLQSLRHRAAHAAVMEKLAQLTLVTLPDPIYNWITDFFQGHSHCTKFAGEVSELADIFAYKRHPRLRSWACSFSGNSSKPIRPTHEGNELLKDADDTYLVVPAAANVGKKLRSHQHNLALNEQVALQHLVSSSMINWRQPIMSAIPSMRVVYCSLYALRVRRCHGIPEQSRTCFRLLCLLKPVTAYQRSLVSVQQQIEQESTPSWAGVWSLGMGTTPPVTCRP